MRPWIPALCATAFFQIATPPARACPYAVEDGDTFVIVATGEQIRLMGYDTPETGERAWCEAEQRLAKKATVRLAEILCAPGAAIAIARNAAKPKDRYGRTLALVTAGGRDIAGIMVAEGWARMYHGGGRRKGWCSRDSRDDLGAASPDGD